MISALNTRKFDMFGASVSMSDERKRPVFFAKTPV